MLRLRYKVLAFGVALILVLGSCVEKSSDLKKEHLRPSLRAYGLEEISSIKWLVETITEDDIREILLDLENFGTRYSPSKGNMKAAHYIRDKFLCYGMTDVRMDEFSYFNELSDLYEKSRNVVASKEGVKTPEKIVIIGGHFDTITRRSEDEKISARDKENPAPGTDDNGTGIAAVLNAAKVLSPFDFDCTLRFVAFSAEEEGLYGSAFYAAGCARKNEDIIAMINVDMIGHQDQQPEDMDVFADNNSVWLLDKLVNNAPLYAPGLPIYRIIDDSYDGSDHGPFWNNGYPAVCFMEDYFPSNRYYHTPNDTIATVDLGFSLKTVKLVTATLAEIAGIHVQAPDRPGENLTEETLRFRDFDWEKSRREKILVTLAPATGKLDIVDMTFPNVHTKKSLVLGEIPSERYAVPHYRPVMACPKPGDKLVFLPMGKVLPIKNETDEGIVKIIDLEKAEVLGSFRTGDSPRQGNFSSDGSLFFLPYWGESHIDIFDSSSWRRVGRVPCPVQVAKLVVNDKTQLGVAVSPESDTIVIIDLRNRTSSLFPVEISTPKDIVLLDDRYALVCSVEDGKLFQLDLQEGEIAAELSVDPKPTKLVMSPNKKKLVSIHHLSGVIGIYDVTSVGFKSLLNRNKRLDLQEVIEDAFFGEDDNRLYLISSSKHRLFGLDLQTESVFWSMRTGGVRPMAGFKQILFIYQQKTS